MDRDLYKARIIDDTVEKYLKTFGAVCIEGPKWCGKTWTSAYYRKCDNNFDEQRGIFIKCKEEI